MAEIPKTTTEEGAASNEETVLQLQAKNKSLQEQIDMLVARFQALPPPSTNPFETTLEYTSRSGKAPLIIPEVPFTSTPESHIITFPTTLPSFPQQSTYPPFAYPSLPQTTIPTFLQGSTSARLAIPNSQSEAYTGYGEKIQHLENTVRSMQGSQAFPSTNLSDLCFFSDFQLPAKFKVPNFNKFDGTGEPMVHLRLYAGALSAYPDRERLCLQLFQHSLTGTAAYWFARLDVQRIRTWEDLSQEFVKHYRHNAQLAVDRMHLSRIRREPSESFRVYALRWKNIAAQVDPPLLDSEFTPAFVQSLRGFFLERLLTSIQLPFADIVRQGEMVEDALESGNIIDSYKNTSLGQAKKFVPPKPRESEVAAILPTATSSRPLQKAQVAPKFTQGTPYPRTQRTYTPLGASMSEVLKLLLASGQISLIPARPPPNPIPTNYRLDIHCAFHSGQAGHDTENCWKLKDRVQDLIDSGDVSLEPPTGTPNVTTNPMPNHK